MLVRTALAGAPGLIGARSLHYLSGGWLCPGYGRGVCYRHVTVHTDPLRQRELQARQEFGLLGIRTGHTPKTQRPAVRRLQQDVTDRYIMQRPQRGCRTHRTILRRRLLAPGVRFADADHRPRPALTQLSHGSGARAAGDSARAGFSQRSALHGGSAAGRITSPARIRGGGCDGSVRCSLSRTSCWSASGSM